MDLNPVDPEFRDAVRRVPRVPLNRFVLGLAGLAVKAMPPPRKPPGVTTRTVRLPGGRSRILVPPGRPAPGGAPALLWIHGGGYIVGSAAADEAWAGEVAARLGIVVVSVEYRLANRHPYPVPHDDCHAAWTWLVSHADELGVDPARLAVGGVSAGGGLAAGLVQRVHDEAGPQPVAQWLWCPMLDAATAQDRSLDALNHAVWDNRSNRYGWGAYLAGGGGAYAAPASRADLAGLPPTWIGSGTVELFHPEDVTYAERLEDAGVPVTLVEVPGAPHAVHMFAKDSPTVQTYEDGAFTWLADRLGVSPPPPRTPPATPAPAAPPGR